MDRGLTKIHMTTKRVQLTANKDAENKAIWAEEHKEWHLFDQWLTLVFDCKQTESLIMKLKSMYDSADSNYTQEEKKSTSF